MIRFDNVQIGYHGKALMQPISFTVNKGDLFGLIGPNGAGKSTLLKILLGILPPVSGAIQFEDGRRPAIGYVPQRDSIETVLPLSVAQVVEMGLRGNQSKRLNRAQKAVAILDAIERLGIADLAHASFRDLSGGQKQRALFARALVANPKVLIFDEPTNGMDIPTEQATLELIDKFRKENGCTTLLVTHLVSTVAPYVNRVAFIDREKNLFAEGIASEMFTGEKMTQLYGRPVRVENCGRSLTVVVE